MKAFKMFHPSSWVPAPERWYELHLDVLSCESPIYGVYVLPPKSTGFLNCLQSKKTGRWIKHPVSLSMRFLLDTAQEKSTVNFRGNMGLMDTTDPTNNCQQYYVKSAQYLTLDWHPLVFFLGGVPRNTRFLSSIDTTRQTWRQNPTVS